MTWLKSGTQPMCLNFFSDSLIELQAINTQVPLSFSNNNKIRRRNANLVEKI